MPVHELSFLLCVTNVVCWKLSRLCDHRGSCDMLEINSLFALEGNAPHKSLQYIQYSIYNPAFVYSTI